MARDDPQGGSRLVGCHACSLMQDDSDEGRQFSELWQSSIVRKRSARFGCGIGFGEAFEKLNHWKFACQVEVRIP